MAYSLYVSVNLPQHEETAFQLKDVTTLDAAVVTADTRYPTWTSLTVTVLRAETPVGEPQ